jgi:hypothetical protein
LILVLISARRKTYSPDEAIQCCYVCRAALDCFAEPVIGRRFAPARWLAMTLEPPRQTLAETATCGSRLPRRKAAIMSTPTKTEAELVAMARAELKAHLDCPGEIMISVLRDGDSWEFRTEADEATKAKPGYPECVAMIVQIGDHLSKQFDVKG